MAVLRTTFAGDCDCHKTVIQLVYVRFVVWTCRGTHLVVSERVR